MDSIKERLNKFLTDSTDLEGYVFAPEQLSAFIKEELNRLADKMEQAYKNDENVVAIIRIQANLL